MSIGPETASRDLMKATSFCFLGLRPATVRGRFGAAKDWAGFCGIIIERRRDGALFGSVFWSYGYVSPAAFERHHRACAASPAHSILPSYSEPSRPSPRGRVKYAALTAPPRGGVLDVRAGTEGWAPQGPNKRMPPAGRKNRKGMTR